MNLFRWLLGIFRGRKSGYSVKSFWGIIKHYNKAGVQIGYSRKTFWGRMNRYDMEGKIVSYSVRNFWGGYNTYDAEGNLIRRSYKNIFGGFTTYDRYGKKIRESYKNFWEVLTHFDIETPDKYERVVFEKRKPAQKVELSDYKKKKQEASELTISKKKQQLQASSISEEEKVVASMHVTKDYSANTEYVYEESIRPNSDKAPDGKNIILSQQKIGRNITYYPSVAECVKKHQGIKQYAKILVFEYKEQKEFPALAHICENVVIVTPLIQNAKTMEFPVAELKNVKITEVTGIDMNMVDNEFINVGVSSLAEEFEELLPEYQFGKEGMFRTQCELECGLSMTEKSIEEIHNKLQV